jgi:hypothetical protein
LPGAQRINKRDPDIYKNEWSIMSKRRSSYAIVMVVCLILGFILVGCQLRRVQNNQPLILSTNEPVQPSQSAISTTTVTQTSVPTLLTATKISQPTVTPTSVATSDAKGDQVEQLLDQLNQMNQNGDPFTDLPQ